jgi:hypothetical protein
MQVFSARAILGAPFLGSLLVALAACGGGDADDIGATTTTEVTQADDGHSSRLASTATLSDSQRIAAATATAQSSTNDCAAVRPFYWEIGSRDAMKAGGSVGAGVSARSRLPYASASKWLYAAYVAQRRQGALTSLDVEMLTLRSGYTTLKGCEPTQSVDACLASGSNGQYSAVTDGRFYYNGGHMQKHASLLGLGAKDNAGLASAMAAQLGSDISLGYSQPQLAGGGVGTAQTYARFLRKLLGGQLRLGGMLGSVSVCTNPASCGSDQALYAPVPPQESWRYSLGHWVESDPLVGDGAFSSPGAFGFYPWIDGGRTHYGILARAAPNGARGSALCGRQIRKAWSTGVAQQARGTVSTGSVAVGVSTRRR